MVVADDSRVRPGPPSDSTSVHNAHQKKEGNSLRCSRVSSIPRTGSSVVVPSVFRSYTWAVGQGLRHVGFWYDLTGDLCLGEWSDPIPRLSQPKDLLLRGLCPELLTHPQSSTTPSHRVPRPCRPRCRPIIRALTLRPDTTSPWSVRPVVGPRLCGVTGVSKDRIRRVPGKLFLPE